MFKTYVFGVVLGVATVIAAAFYFPIVDQVRENSVIRVAPNGGNMESFHINIPVDQIAIGSVDASLPDDLKWPDELASTNAAIYKVRNIRDDVIGIASRVAVQDPAQGNAVEWVLHFPARGSVYATMETAIGEDGVREGSWETGTREFSSTVGRLTERYVAGATDDETRRGRIELESFFVKQADPS